MYTNPRYDTILDYLKRNKRATVAQLSSLVYVSEATMRRDLRDMQRLGLLKRVHGGAIYSEATDEVAIAVRQNVNIQEKEETAFIAISALPEYETLFVDNSSTCLALVMRMNLTHKVVVTNGFRIASALLENDQVRIIMPGGELRKNTDFAGSMTCAALRDFHFDLMLCSCAAISPEGAYETSLAVKDLKRTAMELSERCVLLADRTKFQATAPYRTAGLRNFDRIFTNADDGLLLPYRQAGLPVFNRP